MDVLAFSKSDLAPITPQEEKFTFSVTTQG